VFPVRPPQRDNQQGTLYGVTRQNVFRYEQQKHHQPIGKEFNTLDLFSVIKQGPFT